jgi:hypothetical protein
MYSTLLSIEGRAIRRASIALFGAAMLAACDTDRAVSPTPTTDTAPTAKAPTGADLGVTPGSPGNLVLKAMDGNNVLLGGAQYQVTGPWLYSATVTDNGPSDADATLGILRLVNMKVGVYTICEVAAPATYAIAKPACHTTSVTTGATTVELFFSVRLPYLMTELMAGIFPKGGGVVVIKDSVGTPIMLVADNGPVDASKADGWFYVMLPYPGKFTICGATAPAGYALALHQDPCRTTSVNNGMDDVGPIYLAPLPSVSWDVRDGVGALIGPSSFTISVPRSFTKIDVVDNGLNDLDPTLGRVIAKVPKGAVYTLCETVPPVNHFNAKPSCVGVDVPDGQAVWAGTFVNLEKQVFNP